MSRIVLIRKSLSESVSCENDVLIFQKSHKCHGPLDFLEIFLLYVLELQLDF